MKIITGRMTGDSENESRISQTGTSFKKRKTTNSGIECDLLHNFYNNVNLFEDSPFWIFDINSVIVVKTSNVLLLSLYNM
jgi:hypothetical protein